MKELLLFLNFLLSLTELHLFNSFALIYGRQAMKGFWFVYLFLLSNLIKLWKNIHFLFLNLSSERDSILICFFCTLNKLSKSFGLLISKSLTTMSRKFWQPINENPNRNPVSHERESMSFLGWSMEWNRDGGMRMETIVSIYMHPHILWGCAFFCPRFHVASRHPFPAETFWKRAGPCTQLSFLRQEGDQ